MAEGGFDFSKFIQDSINTITKPKEYFTSMAKEGGFAEPLIKAVIYGTIAGVLTFIWGALKLTGAAGAFGGMLGGGVGVMAIVGAIIGSIIGLFIAGVLVLIVSAICGGNTNYEANVRVAASLMVMSPINALLGFAPGLNLYLGSILSLGVSLYGLWLLYNALVNALGGKEGAAKVVSIILGVIPVLLLVSALLCAKAVTSMGDKTFENLQNMENNQDMQKGLEMLQKMAEEAEKEAAKQK